MRLFGQADGLTDGQNWFPLNNSNDFYRIVTKIPEEICYINTEVKFDMQQNPAVFLQSTNFRGSLLTPVLKISELVGPT